LDVVAKGTDGAVKNAATKLANKALFINNQIHVTINGAL
jgi:hypothetical protein